jgi:hypothetical protein
MTPNFSTQPHNSFVANENLDILPYVALSFGGQL